MSCESRLLVRRRLLKRALDLTALAVCAPLFLTLLGFLALVVLFVDGRPVFFTQLRLGLGRRSFRVLKLRTMTTHADVGARRATRLGQWLRQRGLDELPQMLNVVWGDMSLVGPRPLSPADAERLIALHPPFAERYAVLPGITGLAQVRGARGVEVTARLDAEYAATQSMTCDVRLLIRTLWINVVGKRRGFAKNVE
jgi:lipopolysaccharide/colanic/teichoic acid biosynthesis glycosyltransferase